MMASDNEIVERVGRSTVIEICNGLGCNINMRECCIPRAGRIDLCKECYEIVKEADNKAEL